MSSPPTPHDARQSVDQTISNLIHRMLSDGVHYRDLMDIQASIDGPQDWCRSWLNAASIHEAVAGAALERGRRHSAGEALWRASLYCHFAQGFHTDDRPEQRLEAVQRKQALFSKAAPLLQPPLEPVAIPFDEITFPAYLRVPDGSSLSACAILVGGLDTTKEDAFALTEVLIARGIATLAFDGPGQGETLSKLPLILDFERAVSAVIDYLQDRPEVDADRIGVLGRSSGGHLAFRAASDPRVRAVVAWGLLYDASQLPHMPPASLAHFVRAAGLDSLTAAEAFYEGYNLAGHVEKIRCPMMVVQGGQDPIATPGGLDRVRAEAKAPLEVIFYEDSGHCCHDRSHLIKPAMADFLAEHLG